MTFGIPQGSVLGPLLFSIFVSNIGSDFSGSYSLLADDLNIFKVIKNDSDVVYLLILDNTPIHIQFRIPDKSAEVFYNYE